MAECAGQEFSNQKGFVGQSGFGDDANIRMMREEITEGGANGVTARVAIDLESDCRKKVGARFLRHIQEHPEQAVDMGRLLSRRERIERSEIVDLQRIALKHVGPGLHESSIPSEIRSLFRIIIIILPTVG